MQFPNAGQTFQAKYKLLDILGRGGFAAVYRAVDVEIGRTVAIKILVPAGEEYDSSHVARFLREARVVAQLRDPHTITMFDFGRTEDGLLYMVFEYVAGADLAHKLSDLGALRPSEVVHVLVQLLHALREAHSAGVLHRDIKPANVLVFSYMEDDWRVKLLDFGIAKPGIGQNADPVATLTRAGGIIGTPRYMSPEQLCGDPLEPSTDIYSLGLLAYEMLVGAPAINGRDTRDNLVLQLSNEPLRFPAGHPTPAPLRRIVERMMARSPEDRFPSALDALHALQALERQDSGSSPVPSRHTEPAPPPAQPVGPAPRPPSATTTARQPSSARREISAPLLLGAGALLGIALVVPLTLWLTREPTPLPGPPATKIRLAEELVKTRQPDPPADPPADPEPRVGADETATEAKSGCGQPAPPSGTQTETITFGLSSREWLTYVPPSYDPSKRHPLLMLVHDRTRSPIRALSDTGLRELANEHDFVIVAPQGRDYTFPWEPQSDLEFIAAMIEETRRQYCIDPQRLYAVGHNVGAHAVEELACLIQFSAIATTAFRGSKELICEYEPPVPHIHFVGRKDPYHPIEGGPTCDGVTVVPLATKESLWYQHNRCDGAEQVYDRRDAGVCRTRACEAAFVSCTIDGGRDWPASSLRDFQLPQCNVLPGSFPIAATIWDFFTQHGRNLQPPE